MNRKSVKKNLLSSFLIIVFGIFLFPNLGQSLSSQENKDQTDTQMRIFPIQDYEPYVLDDTRIKVDGINYLRRPTVNADGEVLELAFYLDNFSTKSIDLYGFILAYYETDLVIRRYRKWIKHMDWRKRDFDKEHRVVLNVSTLPDYISPNEVWSKKDPDYVFYKTLLERQKKIISSIEPLPDAYYSPAWKYIEYMRYNPQKGIRFTLHNYRSPSPDKTFKIAFHKNIHADGQEQKDEQKQKPRKKDLKYYLENGSERTIFRAYLKNYLGKKKPFFNRIAIVFFDAQKVDNEGTKPQQGMQPVFKRIYAINARSLK